MKTLSALVLAGAILQPFTACCKSQPETGSAPVPTTVSAASSAAARVDRLPESYTAFGFRLHGRLRAAEPGKNTFISPFSIAVALAMTYNGAQNETKTAMASTLGIAAMPLDQFNASNTALIGSLVATSTGATMKIANSLWASEGAPFKKEFIGRTRAAYDAALENVNFLAPDTLGRINGWVRSTTENRIDNLVKKDDLNNETLLILINAVYFKGVWQEAFKKELTTDRLFHPAAGDAKALPMMRQQGKIACAATEGCQVAALPYRGTTLSMYLVLPAADSGLDALLKDMTRERWAALTASVRKKEGTVVVPKFKAEFEAELNDALTALGMGIAFDRARADFWEMAGIKERICISKVRHKSFVEINEEGTEAAAATSVGMIRATCVMPAEPPFEMICDRPFLYAIADKATGLIVFLGTFETP